MNDTCLECGHVAHHGRPCLYVADGEECECLTFEPAPPPIPPEPSPRRTNLKVCPTCLGAGIIYEDAEEEKDL